MSSTRQRFIFSGIIVGLVAAFLVVTLHQGVAQQRQIGRSKSGVSTAPEARIYLSGSARLTGGKADVKFERDLSKLMADIKVIVTPVGSWSGIYVENVNKNGFTARSGAGDPDTRFNWIVVGERSRECESNIEN